MNLANYTAFSFTLRPHPTNPTVQVSATLVDQTKTIEQGYAEAKAEILAHPLLAGKQPTSEAVGGNLSPARSFNANLTFATPPPTPPAKP